MIVYVESNFVLEIALQQGEQASALELVALAESARIDLALPAFSICEPFETLGRRRKQRDRLSEDIAREMRELSRSQPHTNFAANFRALALQMASIRDAEIQALKSTLSRIFRVAKVLPTTASTFDRALLCEGQHSLAPQDAIVYASIILDLEVQDANATKCFLSRNPKDFGGPGIDAELTSFQCRYIARLSDGLAYVRNCLP